MKNYEITMVITVDEAYFNSGVQESIDNGEMAKEFKSEPGILDTVVTYKEL